MAETILRSGALRVARKKLSIRSTKQLLKNLSWAAEDMADAYRIGAEEAQEIIVERLERRKVCPTTSSAVRDLLVQVAVYFRDQERLC